MHWRARGGGKVKKEEEGGKEGGREGGRLKELERETHIHNLTDSSVREPINWMVEIHSNDKNSK